MNQQKLEALAHAIYLGEFGEELDPDEISWGGMPEKIQERYIIRAIWAISKNPKIGGLVE